MDKDILIPIVEQIHGCTFATLDAITEHVPGIQQLTVGERVIIFRTQGKSGWEGMVKRRLAEAGKDPGTFKVGRLPWGERLGNLPIIIHDGKYYLQTIQLVEGKQQYSLKHSGIIINPKDFGIRPSRGYQGLPPEETVKMHTYDIENIQSITLMGETLGTSLVADKKKRSVLSLKFPDKG